MLLFLHFNLETALFNMVRFDEEFTRFCKLLSLAEECYMSKDFLAAARLAQLAAFIAFPANVGLFSSPRLERLLLDIAKQIPDLAASQKSIKKKDQMRILHVLSYAKPIGGDSRFVWRWMQEDISNQHSLAITLQNDIKDTFAIPDIFISSAKNSGGYVKALNAPTSNPLDQALELRQLCQNVEIVVLHLYPYDIIPILALGAFNYSAKVVFVNHSDHTFWIGGSVAHSVVHLRKQSSEFLLARRNLLDEPMPILPIPIIPLQLPVSRPEAKRLLGYSEDVVLILTIASPFKYSATNQISFLDLVVPVLNNFPQAVLIAVGPEENGNWQAAKHKTDGRIMSLGRRWNNEILYAAADIYLDSVPFSSITSLLEAGSCGTPLLGYRSSDSALHLLGPGAPGLDKAMSIATDIESYQNTLTRLICDADFRQLQGLATKKNILSLHTGTNWQNVINEIYQKIEYVNTRNINLNEADVFTPDKLDYALNQLYDNVQRQTPNRQITKHYIGTLPYYSKIIITWKLYQIGFDLCYLNFLPLAVIKSIRSVSRRIKHNSLYKLQGKMK